MRRRLPSTLILGEAPARSSYPPPPSKAAPWTAPPKGLDWSVRTTVTFRADRPTPEIAIEAVQRTVTRDVPEAARSRTDFAIAIDVHQHPTQPFWTAIARAQWGSH